MLILLVVYKYALSPVVAALGVRCRYDPGCSSYSREAITKHGAWAGGWMTLARLQRCHPVRWLGGSSGVDNVPDTVDKPPLFAPWQVGVWRHTPTVDSEHADADLS